MSIENYLAARSEFTAAEAELNETAAVLAEAASALQGAGRGRFIFANQPIGLPMEATMTRTSRSVAAQRWPTVEKIMKQLERWHKAKTALSAAWSGVPGDQREGLKSPSDLLARYQ